MLVCWIRALLLMMGNALVDPFMVFACHAFSVLCLHLGCSLPALAMPATAQLGQQTGLADRKMAQWPAPCPYSPDGPRGPAVCSLVRCEGAEPWADLMSLISRILARC